MVDMFDDTRSSKYCYLNKKQESVMKTPLLIINVVSFAALMIVIVIASYERDLTVTSNIVIALIALGVIFALGITFYLTMRGDECTPDQIRKLRTDVK